MPSRKKAQGKVRKQKGVDQSSDPLNNDADSQACARKEKQRSNADSQACMHYGRQHMKDWSLDDVDAANKLANEFSLKCIISLIATKDSKQALGNLDRLNHEVYHEYCQFNNNSKKLFKEIMIVKGTTACIAAAKQTDLSKMPFLSGTLPYVCIILTIEARDRYNEVINNRVAGEVRTCLVDITHCPRETVRFFHRRNSCGCLKELYYKLKESTQRTAACWNCMNIVEIRKLSRCLHCKVAQYCSYDCAVAHWQVVHKGECKEIWHCEDA